DAEPVERAPDLLARRRAVTLAGLGCEEEPLAILREPGGEPKLGVAVGRRGVDVIHAVLEEDVEGAIGFSLREVRERRGSEDRARALVPGRTKRGLRDHAPDPRRTHGRVV